MSLGSAARADPQPRRPSPRRSWLAGPPAAAQVAAVTLLAAALRFYRLGSEPYWLDEAITLDDIEHSLAVMWTRPLSDKPPLYDTLQKAWAVFGESEAAVRSLSALIGAATVPLVYLIGRNLRDHRVGLLAALLFAVGAIHIQYAQEARPYALLTAAAALALAGQTYLFASPARATSPILALALGTQLPADRRRILLAWVAYVVGCIVALYSHSIAALLLGAANGTAAIHWIGALRRDRTFLWSWIGANAVVLALWSWWLPIVVEQFQFDPENAWMKTPTLAVAFDALSDADGAAYFGRDRWIPLLVLTVCALVGIGAAVVRAPGAVLPLLACAAGVPVATYLISLFRPILLTRTLLWPSVALLPFLALGIATIRPRALAVLAGALVLALAGRGVAGYYEDFHKTPWDRIAAAIADGPRERAAILVCPGYESSPLRIYLRRLGVSLPVVQLWEKPSEASSSSAKRFKVWETRSLDPATASLWLVQHSSYCEVEPAELLAQLAVGGRWEQTRQTYPRHVLTLLRRADAPAE